MPARQHGLTGTRTHRIWAGMLQRCTNPNVQGFKYYGGRGITVCKRWHDFMNFLADMGECPIGHTIEREKNNRGYSPRNCVWLPAGKQAQNRRGNVLVEVDGETVCVEEAARRLGIKSGTVRYRAKRAVNKKSLTAPVGRDVFLTLNGETLNMKQWSERLGIKRSTICMRHKWGWPVERILEAKPSRS